MKQDNIWDHWQNEGDFAFDGSLPRLEFLVRRLQPGWRVLNIGIGNASFERLALERGVEVWSLDPSERAIEQARQKLGLGDNAQVGRVEAQPFETGFFDAVVMSEVLEHLDPETLAKALPEIARVLKGKGQFIGTVPANENLAESLVVCPSCDAKFHRWGHQLSFDRQRMHAVLAQHFEHVRVEEKFFAEWHSVGTLGKLKGLIKRVLSDFRVGTYATARNLYFSASKA
jgi:SAM-dependent methyltransferase